MSWWGIGISVGSAIDRNLQEADRKKERGDALTAQQAGIDRGIAETRTAAGAAQGFLLPAAQAGQQGFDQANFLTDPQAQVDFLQNNPLFQMSLENANTETKQLAAAKGRLSAGDTLEQLSKNVLLSSQPLIAQQKSSISDLINLGSGTGVAQANLAIGQGTNVADLLTSSGDVNAASIISSSNIEAQQSKADREAIGSSLAAFSGRT